MLEIPFICDFGIFKVVFFWIVHTFTVRKFHSLQFAIFCFRELEFLDVFFFGFMTIKDFLFVLAISFFFGLFHFY